MIEMMMLIVNFCLAAFALGVLAWMGVMALGILALLAMGAWELLVVFLEWWLTYPEEVRQKTQAKTEELTDSHKEVSNELS